MRHGLQRPPMYGEKGGLQGEITLAELLSGGLRDAGGRQVAPRREPRVAAAERRLRRLLRLSSVSDMYTEWRDRTSSPRSSTEERSALDREPAVQQVLRARVARRRAESVEEVTIPVLSLLDDKWAAYSIEFIKRMAGDGKPWLLYHGTRGTHFDNYPHERFLGKSPRSIPTRTPSSSSTTSSDVVAALRESGQLEHTKDLRHLRQRPRWRPGDAAYTRRWLRQGLDVGGRPARARHRVAGHDRSGPRIRTDCSQMDVFTTALRSGGRIGLDAGVHRRRRPDVVPARRRRPLEPQVHLLLARAAVLRAASANTSSCWRRSPTTIATCTTRRLHRRDAEVSRTAASTTSTWTPRSSAAT